MIATNVLPSPTAVKRRKADRLPKNIERFTDAITAGIIAASKAPNGTVNVADYLDAPQLRMLVRLAQKNSQTPRQFVQSLVNRMVPKSRAATAGAGGAA